jgi:hypothetical protein
MFNLSHWDLHTYAILVFLIFQAALPTLVDVWKRNKKISAWVYNVGWVLLCWWLFYGLSFKGFFA